MASFVYAVWSITNVASVHCAVRPEISPCTCEPIYAHNYVELSCEKVDSFHQIVDALSNKFEPFLNISLKISHSQLEDLEMRSFTDMNLNLVKLRMQWNSLKSVPELPFRGLSNVEYLSVSDNELEEIPKHMLNHMPIVKTFDMGRCRIRSVLQDDFKGIQMVMNLFLPSNNITRLDKGAFPTGLVTLHLGRNQIENLNGTLRDLSKLESLFINMNSITNLDDELPESYRLKLILAQNNRIDHLPDSMRHMGKLETLHLQHNRIRSLDGIFKHAKNLNQFYAFNNEIEYLAQDEFQECETLEELDLAFNSIKSLNFSLLPLSRLVRANFSLNEIEEFSMNEIRGLVYLRQLDLSNNRIQKLTGHQENNIDQNSYLIEFNLDHNHLKSLDGALMGLNSLRILSLSYNQLERILPEDFIGLVKLEILELSHNQLLTLKEMERTFLPNLKILKAAYNNLTKLEKDFHGLPVLCQANLTSNQISTISAELVSQTRCMNHNVPGKLELHLDDNPILCDNRLNELCPIMLKQETRIRGRSQCFESDQEVCTVLSMLFPNYPIVIPPLNQQVLASAKPVVIVQPPILLNTPLKKPEDILPPLIASLGQPIIIAHAPTNTATTTTSTITTTTTTTTTPEPQTTTSTAATAVEEKAADEINIPSLLIPSIKEKPMIEPEAGLKRLLTNSNDDGHNTDIKAELPLSLPVTTTTTSTTTTTTLAPNTNQTVNAINDVTNVQNYTNATTNTEAAIAEEIPAPPPIVLDIADEPTTASTPVAVAEDVAVPIDVVEETVKAEETPVVSDTIAEDTVDNVAAVAAETALKVDVAIADTGVGTGPAPTTSAQTEYATMEYIPKLDEYLAGNHAPPNLLDEDSNSNSVHEEFPSVVLAHLDNAPQSLLIPDEPPENP